MARLSRSSRCHPATRSSDGSAGPKGRGSDLPFDPGLYEPRERIVRALPTDTDWSRAGERTAFVEFCAGFGFRVQQTGTFGRIHHPQRKTGSVPGADAIYRIDRTCCIQFDDVFPSELRKLGRYQVNCVRRSDLYLVAVHLQPRLKNLRLAFRAPVRTSTGQGQRGQAEG